MTTREGVGERGVTGDVGGPPDTPLDREVFPGRREVVEGKRRRHKTRRSEVGVDDELLTIDGGVLFTFPSILLPFTPGRVTLVLLVVLQLKVAPLETSDDRRGL